MMNKLSRTISTTEQHLPQMRRKVGGVEYGRLREGLLQCRDQKDQCMDELEDIKESENMDVETYISKLEDMTKVLLEHQDALSEAFNKMKVAAASQAKKEVVPDQAEAGPLGKQNMKQKMPVP